MTRPALLVLPLCLLVSLTPGCGSDDDREKTFKRDFGHLSTQIATLGGEVERATKSARRQSDSEIERRFGGLSRKTAKLRQGLAALNPPDDLRADNRALIGALGRAQRALTGIARAAHRGSASAARKATAELARTASAIKQARTKLLIATNLEIKKVR